VRLVEIYVSAGLTPQEIEKMPTYIAGEVEFYDSSAFQKLYEYFAFETGEMPYSVAKARTQTPDEWILEQLS
tara:strand:- start:224 stop:439 length:216 start_codon:yes stop_codon:yes gene_type:complete